VAGVEDLQVIGARDDQQPIAGVEDETAGAVLATTGGP
jgi:hypothetical protein